MKQFLINGGNTLWGDVEIESSKNALLPLIASAILSEETTILHKVPHFLDIHNMIKILQHIGLKVNSCDEILTINGASASKTEIGLELTTPLRSSIYAMGALLGRFKKVKICYPGGCDIGLRPIDLHLRGLKDLNVKVIEQHGNIYCDGSQMRGGKIFLDFPSVGATVNLMLASVLAKGTTTIFNSAKEPEIVDLQNFLNKMGAKIKGAGTSTIIINGVKKLHNVEYTPIADRIVAGTYILASAMCGGKITLHNCVYDHNQYLFNLLSRAGSKITINSSSITVENSKRLKSIPKVETNPFPLFPTDLQPQFMALQCVSLGNSIIVENLYETRYKHVPELMKMGANIIVKNQSAYINGVEHLYGAEVKASDLRAGAGLVLAGLSAKGYTTINAVEHILRGYDKFDKKLRLLGADISLVETNN